MWADTTTLYTRILRGHVAPEEKDDAEIVAAGIIRIHFADFLKQLTTFDAKGPSSAAERREFLAFAKFFLGSLWDVYGRHVSQKN